MPFFKGETVSLNNQDRQQSALVWKGKKGLDLEVLEFGTSAESGAYRHLLIEGNTNLFFLSPKAHDLIIRADEAVVLTWEWNFLRSLYFWWEKL